VTEAVPDATITFAAVPYVKTQAPFDLGPWRLWPNTTADWTREMGVDLTWFMRIYERSNGAPVDSSGSILTRSDNVAATREEFRDAIVAFSTLAWLAGDWRADPWIFELWTMPRNVNELDHFARRGKFTTNVTNARLERVRFGPYVFPLEMKPWFPPMMLDFMRSELARRDDSRMLRALRQLHEVRFETPYFSSLGNDLEALWTGFETLFLPRQPAQQQLPMSLFERLLRALRRPPDVRRPTRLYAAIERDLAGTTGVHPRSYSQTAAFVALLWDARNAHSHDGVTEPDVDIEKSHLNLLSMGLSLFRDLLRIRVAQGAGDTVHFLPSAVRSLNEIFTRQETISSVVEALKKADPLDLCPPRNDSTAVRDLCRRLTDLVAFEGLDGWNDNRDVAKARGVLRRALNAWIKAISPSELAGAGLIGVAEFPALDLSRLKELKEEGRTGPSLEDALDETLVDFVKDAVSWRSSAATLAAGGTMPPERLDLRLCIRAYVRLEELFLGYPLI
jgi:hypothetical protein